VISVTHIVAGYTIGELLDLEKDYAAIASVIPDVDVLFSFAYPFSHRGITHTLVFILVAGLGIQSTSGEFRKTFSVILGLLTHLLLDSLTFSGIPVFFPLGNAVSASLTSANDLYWNLSLISVFMTLTAVKKNSRALRELLDVS
jgi:inner membrane protein